LIAVKHPSDLLAYVGRRLGTSEWTTIGQNQIDRFAAVTGDDNWIHVDTARAARDLPGGRTIAHGFLTLSMTAALTRQIIEVGSAARIINYGVENVRFPATVPAGSRIRLTLDLAQGEHRPDGGYRFTLKSTVEADGQSKPVCVFDKLLLIYPSGP
jgi:acyl dehydratase